MTRFSGLRARLLLVVLLGMLPLLGLVLYTGVEQRRLAAAAVHEQALRVAERASVRHELLVEGAHRLLMGLAQIPEVRALDAARCPALVADILKEFPELTNLGAMTPGGDLVCSARPLRGPVNEGQQPYFQGAVTTRRFAIGAYRIGPVTGKPLLSLAYPAVDAGGVVRAVVGAGLNLAWINELAAHASIPEGSVLRVIDHAGTILAGYPDAQGWVGKSASQSAIFQAILGQPRGGVAEVAGVDGEVRLYGFTPLGGLPPERPVYVSVGIPPRVAFAEVNRLLARNLAGLGLVGALALGAAWIGIDAMVLRRVTALVRTAKRLAGGDLTGRTGMAGDRTELGQLARAFDEMAESLQVQHDGLEGKVAERTQALAERTREAQATAAELRAQDAIRRGYAELAALLNSLNRSHILEEGTRKIASTLQAPLAAVYLTDDGPDALRLKTYAALDPAGLDAAWLSPAGLPAEVARRREPIVLARADGAERLVVRLGVGELEAAAVAGWPLAYQDRTLGVLVVALLEPLGEHTRSFCDNAARQLSVALNNAALFESVRYQSQQLERLNARLGQASEAKSQFLASMSHELRTPLNSIIGFTELLLASARDPLSERQRTALEKVHGSGRHLLGLINDVLDLAKIEAGRMEVRAAAFDLGGLVRECLAAVEPQAQAKGLGLRATGLDAAPELEQDRGKVKQVLLNLLANAVKFTAAGSVELRVAPDGEGWITLAVADTGAGIRAEDQAAVFDSFRQLDHAHGGAVTGTGLGLAISRRLAELTGGTLTLESVPGAGSVFTLRLPLRYAARPEPEPAGEPEAPPPGVPRLLVIDDDRDAVEIVRGALENEPVRVEWASRAATGLARARADRPAAILLDVILQEGGDGWEVLRALKADARTRDIPVVVHSVINNPERARELGAQAVLAKPAPGGALKALLRRVRAGVGRDGEAGP